MLVSAPLKPGDFATVQPIEKNVQLVRELKQSGHHITISTCRGMQEHGGNVGAVIAACGHQTLQVRARVRVGVRMSATCCCLTVTVTVTLTLTLTDG